jgi:hypothetical protein
MVDLLKGKIAFRFTGRREEAAYLHGVGKYMHSNG